jgi:hypothetical protein
MRYARIGICFSKLKKALFFSIIAVRFEENKMKIKLEREKIVGAVRKLAGVDVVIEDADDAKEALDLIVKRADFSEGESSTKLDDINVTVFREYENSAVEYKVLFLLEFVFEADVSADLKISFIKKFQDFFGNA